MFPCNKGKKLPKKVKCVLIGSMERSMVMQTTPFLTGLDSQRKGRDACPSVNFQQPNARRGFVLNEHGNMTFTPSPVRGNSAKPASFLPRPSAFRGFVLVLKVRLLPIKIQLFPESSETHSVGAASCAQRTAPTGARKLDQRRIFLGKMLCLNFSGEKFSNLLCPVGHIPLWSGWKISSKYPLPVLLNLRDCR